MSNGRAAGSAEEGGPKRARVNPPADALRPYRLCPGL